MKIFALVIVLVALALLAMGIYFYRRAKPDMPRAPSSQDEPSDITARDVPPDAPPFGRQYRATVNIPRGPFVIEINMETSKYRGRTDRYSTVTQPNGTWILFNPNAVADKILDRELYPHVQRIADQALAMDAKYVEEQPDTFTDAAGTTWRRQTTQPNQKEQ